MSSSTVYCWFDWEDNTTTVNSINIIKEPRKPWMEYEKGERVLAKLPQFGLWHGVIVEISESKKDLVQKMTARQKAAASAALEPNGDTQINDKDNESDMQKKNTSLKPMIGNNKDEDDSDTHEGEKGNGKKKEKVSSKKRTVEDVDKAEVKKKKKTDEAMKQEAKNKQLEAIIMERRKNRDETEKTSVLQSHTHCDVDESYVNSSSQSDRTVTPILPLHTEQTTHQDSYGGMVPVDPPTIQYWQGNQFGSPFSAFNRYSYVGDLMSPSTSGTSTFHSLASQNELQDRCARLELENEQLKNENEQLRSQLERLSQDSQTEDVDVTPRKVEFLKQIVSSFEKKTKTIRSQPVGKQKVYVPKPVRLTYGEAPDSQVEPLTPPSASQAMDSNHFAEQTPQLQENHWEECVMSSGVKKVRLHPEYEVYLTMAQISQVKHAGSSNPRKMTIALLDAMFTKEQLARSSAKGSKKAHNATIVTVPLPAVAVQAIKEYVLTSFKKDSGEPCLTDPVFNDIINSKCATARRALNR